MVLVINLILYYNSIRQATPLELLKRSWTKNTLHLDKHYYQDKLDVFKDFDKDEEKVKAFVNEKKIRRKNIIENAKASK